MVALLHQVLVLCWQSLPSWHRLWFHETNSWWQSQYTPFPQLCQHKCRCGCSVTMIKELAQLKNNLTKTKSPPLSASEPRFGFQSHPERSHANSCTSRCEGMGSRWHRARMRGREGWQYCKSVFTAQGEVFTSVKLLP